MSEFTYTLDSDGVAVITWDQPGKAMNVMTLQGLDDLGAAVDRALADPAVKGVVITSAKKDFAGGMDLSVIARLKADAGDAPAKGLFDGFIRTHALLRRIERAGMDPKTLKGGKPIAAALPGSALGIGLELALSCHRIFAADNRGAKIGLPEIGLGIFPGAGGTTRMARILGLQGAWPWLLEGKLFDPQGALSAGVVNEVTAPEALLDRARAWVLAATGDEIVKPWDRNGYRMPGGGPHDAAGGPMFLGGVVMAHGKTMGNSPAHAALLSAIYEGALVDFDTALRIEARWMASVLLNPASTATVRTNFLSKTALDKGANRPEAPDQTVCRLGVIGAGMMGAGIAHVSANAGIEVVLIDASQEAADRGKAHSARLLDSGIKRGRVTDAKKVQVLDRITATTDYAALAGCDLVVEAVFEDIAVKADVTRKVEAVVGPDCIFATNTSTLPITDLARASARPDQFIGIHFFSPVDRMALVEIIRGKATGDRAVAKALDYARQIRKTPIVVNDARYFYANRCIVPYLNECLRLVGEGVAPALVENGCRMLGMPVGGLQLMDETSIDLGVKIAEASKAALRDAYPHDAADAVLIRLLAEGRLGRKNGKGFYDYDDKGKRLGLWPGLATLYPPLSPQPDAQEVQHRLILSQVIEAVRALEEGVLTDVREGDVAAVLGWGFAPWSGGPFGWLEIVGAARAVGICDELTARHGARFTAPDLLRRMAASGRRFYDEAGNGTIPARTA